MYYVDVVRLMLHVNTKFNEFNQKSVTAYRYEPKTHKVRNKVDLRHTYTDRKTHRKTEIPCFYREITGGTQVRLLPCE